MSTGWIVLGVLAVIAFWIFSVYNGLVALRQRVGQSFADIDVQLKQRHDLIPNLVETVKGYAAHERETLEAVTRARAMLDNANTPAQAAQADNMLTGALRSLFAVSEAYPDLKANENFMHLQRELTDTEDKIAYARQFYNANVRNLNEKIQVFPNVFVARMFGFTEEEFYEAEAGAREDVRVDFGTARA